MLDLIAQDGLADAMGVFLVLEFRGVYSDDDELVGVFLLQPGQVRQDVHAIDAAEGPEIQEHDLPFEVFFQGERAGRIEPGYSPFQFRGGDRLAGRGCGIRHRCLFGFAPVGGQG